jgi:crotonobetainyl-CoA:carnitine CoA-transferase CaiB-like acyl-CoA transferase
MEGFLVLDFTTLLPGPLATQLMRQAGARVVKIERPGGGDELRGYLPRFGTTAVAYMMLNEGKEILELDLKTGDRSELEKLIQECDVLVEQFRPGVMDRLGLGYDHVRRVNPDIVYCSITGFGQTGPLSAVAGHDLNYLAEAGVLSLTEPPALPPVLVADIGGGSFPAVTEVLLALLRRERGGGGARIDVAMARNLFNWLSYQLSAGFLTGEWPSPGDGLTTGGSARYNLYPAADGRYVAVAALEDKFWAQFCLLAGLPETADGAAVAGRIAQEPGEYWEGLLAGHDTCVNMVRPLHEAVRHPHFADLFATPLYPGAPIPGLPLPSGGVPTEPEELPS